MHPQPLTNWAGNHTYVAERITHPASVAELQELVAGADRVRPLGSRHSFTDIADTTGTLVALDELPTELVVDPARRVASVSAGSSYGAVAKALQEQGWALANLASLPHISIAGAVSTGTHGSGIRNRSLAAAVEALDVVGPDGHVRTVRRGDDDFAGSVVALGALGVVTRTELGIEPTFDVRQTVHTGLPFAALDDTFDAVVSSGYSVSLFTHFTGEVVDQVWVKSRVDEPPPEVLGALSAERTMSMFEGAPTDAVTEQLGIPGAWLDRLPHFRHEFTPSRGEELQSEYLVPRPHATEAIRLLRGLSAGFAPLLHVAEIRTVAADDLWLSGAYGHDVVGFHFTWVRDVPAVRAVLPAIEDALLPLGARPHWGKVFCAEAAALEPLYPRFADFRALCRRVDPAGKFGNDFLERTVHAG